MNASFFSRNRRYFARQFPDSLLVLTGYDAMQRSNDAAFRFEQEANFWYLTGIEEAGWKLVIDTTHSQEWLVMPSRTEVQRVFEGGLSSEQASGGSGVVAIASEREFHMLIRERATLFEKVYTFKHNAEVKGFSFAINPAQQRLNRYLARYFEIEDCQKQLTKLRAIKQPDEIALIQRAIDITIEAFDAIRKERPSLRTEYEIEGLMTQIIRSRGADGHAYDPIVASGINACTLHYGRNDAHIDTPGLVLIDVGARYGGYAADITRTISFGEPTERQRMIHNEVATAHREIIESIKAGLSVVQYQQFVDDRMKCALARLGLLDDASDDVTYRRYFPHAISHGLGIDVHDSLGRPEKLRAGMVLTVEPGVYIPEEGVGVRIEDDILVTEDGYKNLSASLSTNY